MHVELSEATKRVKRMPSTLRLSQEEQESLRKKCVEINKLLIKQGREPLKDSELAHIILQKAVPCVEVGQSGEVRIAPE